MGQFSKCIFNKMSHLMHRGPLRRESVNNSAVERAQNLFQHPSWHPPLSVVVSCLLFSTQYTRLQILNKSYAPASNCIVLILLMKFPAINFPAATKSHCHGTPMSTTLCLFDLETNVCFPQIASTTFLCRRKTGCRRIFSYR